MFIAVDIGNTNVVFGVFNHSSLILKARIQTSQIRTWDEYAAFLIPLLNMQGISLNEITSAVISCVSPLALNSIELFFQIYCKFSPIVLSSQNHEVKVKNQDVVSLGSDLAANAIAVYNIYKKPSIIIDFGTATTFSTLEILNYPNYLGVTIAPGLNSMIKAFSSTAQLPNIAFSQSNTALGHTTKESMISGIYFGFIGMIEKIIQQIESEVGSEFQIIATGGLSHFISSKIKKIEISEPDLTLFGLMHFHLNNSLKVKKK